MGSIDNPRVGGRTGDRGHSFVRRRKLSHTEAMQWEEELGSAWSWDGADERDAYIPAENVAPACTRHEFPREPRVCHPVHCYLCGFGCNSKTKLVQHWRSHIDSEDGLSDTRVEEEIRKRVFFHEEEDGPYDVRGQEMRRCIGVHAQHQTHSYPGTDRRNHDRPLTGGVGRALGGCAICARSFWVERLVDLDLFVQPDTGDQQEKEKEER